MTANISGPTCSHKDGCQNLATSNVVIQKPTVVTVRNLCEEHLSIVQKEPGKITHKEIVPTTDSTLPEGFQSQFLAG